MERLSLILWRERELIETLLFKLEEERLVLASGKTRWLMRAAREVEAVLEQIRETEIVRSAAAEEAALRAGLVDNSSLRALAESVAEPWQSILLDHRDASEELTKEVEQTAESNRALIAAGLRSARETMLAVTDTTDGYAADGQHRLADADRRRLIDRSL